MVMTFTSNPLVLARYLSISRERLKLPIHQ